MPRVLNRKKNYVSDFTDFYFSSNGRFCAEISSKYANLECKNDHISKTKNDKNLKNQFFIRFSTFRIFQVNMTTSEGKKLSMNLSIRPASPLSIRTLASLVNVWIRFTKISYKKKYMSPVHCWIQNQPNLIN